MTQAQPQTLPLLFSFKQIVVGNGFVAGVRMNGRALLETESADGQDEFWITGIAPVGIAGGGVDRGVAFSEFRKAWTEVVFDIAAESKDFKEFERSCRTFLQSAQTELTELWDAAVATVRRQQYVDASLRRGNANQHVSFDVADLSQHLKTDSNEVENGLQVAA